MDRRQLIAGLAASPAAAVMAGRLSRTAEAAATIRLTPSGPVTSRADGQVIERLAIDAGSGNAVTVLHRGVTVRQCRIGHAQGHGVHARGAAGLMLSDLDIAGAEVAAPPGGRPGHCNNIDIENSPNSVVMRIRASRGSSNIYALASPGMRLGGLELYDARGPSPRGQNIQFDRSPDCILQDFSAENGPASWTEDNVSVFRSDRCTIRRGLVFYNNSPTGDGVMIEGSSDCLVEDVDAVQQGNGAFAAVPQGAAGCGGCTFRRCRTRDSYNRGRDGRPAPSSNGLSFYLLVSAGARRHSVIDCHYDALANPANLIWDTRALSAGWSLTRRRFVPRRPIRLAFRW